VHFRIFFSMYTKGLIASFRFSVYLTCIFSFIPATFFSPSFFLIIAYIVSDLQPRTPVIQYALSDTSTFDYRSVHLITIPTFLMTVRPSYAELIDWHDFGDLLRCWIANRSCFLGPL